ncbi:MAG: Ig-like domain-containing protein [Myxococcota bacterium]
MRVLVFLVVSSLFLACGQGEVGVPDPLPPAPPQDAGGGDSGVPDAGLGELDAGPPDSGLTEPDAGAPDAGVTDAGAADAGVADAGAPDAGAVDAGAVDAGAADAGAPDAGCVCAAPNYCDAMDRCVADTVAPRVTIAAMPAAGNTQLHVTGTASDDETGLASVAVQLNGGTTVAAVVQAGQWQLDLPISLMGALNQFSLVAVARDRAGNEGRANTSVTIDVAGPTVTLTPSQNGACANGVCTGAVISGSTQIFTLAATVADPSGLAMSSPVQVRVLDGTMELVAPTDMTPSGSVWSWSWSTFPLVDGRPYTMEVTASDLLGNRTTSSLVVFVDRVGPSVALTPAQDGACAAGACSGAFVNGAATSFALGANVIDGQGLAASHPVRVRVLDGATELVPPSDLSAAGSLWSWSWTTLPLVDGRSYTLEVTAADAAGNATVARRAVLVDRVGPSLSLTSQDASCSATGCTGAVVSAANATFQLAATATDGLGLAATGAVRVRVLDGASVVVPATDLSLQAGAWSYAWAAPLVDGRYYSMEVTATDAAGNASSRSRVVLVDRVNPTLLVNSPRQGTLVGNAQVVVNASASDGFGLKTVELSENATAPWTAAALDANGDWVGQLPVPTVDAVAQTIRVRATDLVGNSRTTTTQYTADRVAPTLTLDARSFDCAGADACTGSVANLAARQLTFGGQVTDGSAVTLEKTMVDASGAPQTSTAPQAVGRFSIPWNFTANVNGEAWELRVVAVDAAQNRSPVAVVRTWVDTVAPTMSIPVASQRLVPRVAPMVAFSEPMNAASVRGATSVTPAAGAAIQSTDGRSFSFPAGALLAYTPYTLNVGTGALDKAGNPVAAAASGSFLTEVLPLAVPAAVPVVLSSQGRLPRIAVDSDGRPTVSFASVVLATNVVSGRVASYDGRDWVVGSLAGLGTDVRIGSATQLADRRLDTTIDLLYSSFTAPGTLSFESRSASTLAPPAAGPAALGAMPAFDLASMGRFRPSLEYVPWRSLVIGGGTSSGTNRVTYSPGAPSSLYTVTQWFESSGWTQTVAGSISASARAMDARAVVDVSGSISLTYAVRVFEGATSSVMATRLSNDLHAPNVATAQPPVKVPNILGGATPVTATWGAWASIQGLLTVSCNPSFPSGAWLSSSLSLPSRSVGNPLSSALTSEQFVVAGEFGGNIHIYKVTQPASCAAAPVISQVGVITGGSEPSVAIAPDGKIWVAWVDQGSVLVRSF